MRKILSVMAVGLVAGSLSIGAVAADAAKPAVVSVSKVPTVSAVKKDTSTKTSLKKMLPSAKKVVK